jgi:phenylacetate-coenzyme A ligase PaaK-like adenylate-forming protein
MPLIRYRTGDLSRFIPGDCPCGTVLRRMAHVDGRAASTALVGGHELRHRDLDECLLALPGVVDFRATSRHGDQGDELHLAIKQSAGHPPIDAAALEAALRRAVPALADQAEPHVAIRVRAWLHDGPTGKGTSKRTITTDPEPITDSEARAR